MSSRVMAAHQPLFLPYLGYFSRMKQCDVFVIRDDTQFAKRNFHHRNRIRVPAEEKKLKWLTVPVPKSPVPLHQVEINHDTRIKNRSWQKDMELQIRGCYAHTPFFHGYFGPVTELLHRTPEKLVDLNMNLIYQFCEWFEVKTKIVRATEVEGFRPTGDPTDDLVLLTQLTECDEYLSGDGGGLYIQSEPFDKAGLKMTFQNYSHPTYDQQESEFVPYLACIDALFHLGSGVKEII